jgi:DNA-binding GntR family transcriptional regulator
VTDALVARWNDRLDSVSLVDLAFSRLRTDILSGALEPGQRLVEEQLTRRFEISRAPIREALRLLAEQGLVEHLPRRGVRVATMSDRDYDELFAIRELLERFAIDLITADDAAKPDVAHLRTVLARLAEAVETADPLAASEAHNAFHIALVAVADNLQLTVTYEPIIFKLQLYMAANLRREAQLLSPLDGVRRHKRLLDAVASGNAERARTELRHHGARSFFR